MKISVFEGNVLITGECMKQVSDVTAVVLSKSSSNGSWFVLNIIELAPLGVLFKKHHACM